VGAAGGRLGGAGADAGGVIPSGGGGGAYGRDRARATGARRGRFQGRPCGRRRGPAGGEDGRRARGLRVLSRVGGPARKPRGRRGRHGAVELGGGTLRERGEAQAAREPRGIVE